MNVKIIEFSRELASYFRDLNYEWLDKYFTIEAFDRQVLNNPEVEIIDEGGHVFFAKYDNLIVGTAALVKESEGRYELSKMAVRPDHRGKGIGKMLLEKCIAKAEEIKAEELFLFSNTVLHEAIQLYLKYGFNEVPFDSENTYARTNIKMVLRLRN